MSKPKIANLATTSDSKYISENVKLPTKTPGAKTERRLLANDTWVTGELVDVIAGETANGLPTATYTFEVTNPRRDAGMQLRYVLHEKLVEQFNAANEHSIVTLYPGMDPMNADSVWAYMGAGVQHRIHIGQAMLTNRETGEVRTVNRIVSFRLSERDRA